MLLFAAPVSVFHHICVLTTQILRPPRMHFGMCSRKVVFCGPASFVVGFGGQIIFSHHILDVEDLFSSVT